MRAERAQRLAQAARLGNTSVTTVDPRRGHEKPHQDTGRQAVDHTGRAATSLEEYRREMDELAAPVKRDARATQHRRGTVVPEDNDPAQRVAHSVDPHDVYFFPARSVLADYIHRPIASAPSPRHRNGLSTSSLLSGKQTTARSRTHSDAPPPANHRTSASGRTAHERGSGRSASVKAPAPHQSSLGSSALDDARWTRAAVLRCEATTRTLKANAKEERKRSTRKAHHDEPSRSTRVAAPDYSGNETAVNGRVTPWPRPSLASSTTAATAAPVTGDSPGQPARALFAHSWGLPIPQQQRSAAPSVGFEAPSLSSQWHEPAKSSRFQPIIQYGLRSFNASSVSSRENASPRSETALGTWRAHRDDSGAFLPLDRLSVSPPTPSPPGTRERQPTSNGSRAIGELNHAAGLSWSVPGPSFTRPDLYQGHSTERPQDRPHWDRIGVDVAPHPRSVQPHPRPLWFHEGKHGVSSL